MKILIMLAQILFIVRFHLEISRVNAHIEPIVTLRKITNPVVLPMKQIMPFLWAKKFAAIKIAYFIGFVWLLLLTPVGFFDAIFLGAIFLLSSWVTFLQYGMFIYVIGSWIRVEWMQKVNYVLYHLFEPLLRPIRKILPSFGGIDFSPMVFLLGLSFINNWFWSAIGVGG